MQRGYFQELDTVNFDYESITGITSTAKLLETKAKIVLYSIYYDLVLSPNQIFDLLFLREGLFEFAPGQPGLALPFVFAIDSQCYHEHFDQKKDNMFQKQLTMLLERPGKDAFIFSSIANGALLAQQWGNFLEKQRELSDEAILSEARQVYGEIIEWARRLDAEARKLRIIPYKATTSFRELLRESNQLSELHSAWRSPLPSTRSQGYQIVQSSVPSENQADAKEFLNLISNIQYASGAGSRLILEPKSPYSIEKPVFIEKKVAGVAINLDGLFELFPTLMKDLAAAEFTDISIAIYRARKCAERGWENIDDISAASRYFSDALKKFIKSLLKVNDIGANVLVDMRGDVAMSGPKAGLPIGKLISYLWIKHKLHGIDKLVSVVMRQ